MREGVAAVTSCMPAHMYFMYGVVVTSCMMLLQIMKDRNLFKTEEGTFLRCKKCSY